MNWIKKLNKKRQLRHDEIGHKVFGDIWDNKKERALLFLILWLIFMMFVIGIVRTENQRKNNNNNTNNKEVINYPTISAYFDNINNDNYNFNISIYDVNNASFTYYNGEVNNGVESGTKETTGEVINYVLKNGIAYDLNNQVVNNFYGNYLTKFFKLNNIYDYIKDYEPEITYESDLIIYKYNEKYNDKDIEFIIKGNQKSITYIEYNYDNYKYIVNITNTINND